MTERTPWNSQPLGAWSEKYARGKTIELDGHKTHFYKLGSGPPLVLIHGFFFDGNMWNPNLEVLSEKHTLYVLDLWGFGFSTREPLEYGYELYSRQLELFLDAVGIERTNLAGQSMGGGTIIKFATENRNRIEKIVLVNGAGMTNPMPLIGKFSNLPLVGETLYSLPGSFVRRKVLLNNFIHNPDRLTDAYFDEITNFQKIKGSSEVMLRVTRRDFFDKLENELRKVAKMEIPTLIVWGRQEASIPLATGEKLHQVLTGSQFEALDEAGHCSNIDRPDEFNRLVLEFLG